MYNKKGIGPVVAVALLIVVSVVAVLGFQTWYQTYSSQIFSKTEVSSNTDNLKTGIETVINSQLYFNNNLDDNIFIQSIRVNDKDCNFYSSNYSKGIHKFNLYDCINEINSSSAEFLVVTNSGIYSKEFNLNTKTVSSIPIESEPVYTDTFISVWNTSEISSGSSANNQISLPLISTGNYDFNIDWGDGTIERITSYVNNTHTYDEVGIYTIEITGLIQGWAFIDSGDKLKLYQIKAWGPLKLTDTGKYFYGCENFDFVGYDSLNLTGIESFYQAFKNAKNFNGNINSWDVSQITDMRYMFQGASSFNQPLNNWDVSSLSTSLGMFWSASSFNQPLNNWDVSHITNMAYMFYGASSFNQDLDEWNVSNIENLAGIFSGAILFNGDISNWNLSSLSTLTEVFYGASSFNQDISSWDVSKITNLNSLFLGASSFNQDISSWDVGNVENMNQLFMGTDVFDQDLSSWNVSKVTDMNRMFANAKSFNQDISLWNVSQVTNMDLIFYGASSFNQNLSGWNVNLVTTYTSFDLGATSWNESFKPIFN